MTKTRKLTKNDIDKELATLIRTARLEAGVTQADLADFAGVSRPTIVNLEAGRCSTPFPRVVLLSRALGINLNVFVEGNNKAATESLKAYKIRSLENRRNEIDKQLRRIK